jgi:hypothetical protein
MYKRFTFGILPWARNSPREAYLNPYHDAKQKRNKRYHDYDPDEQNGT